MLKQFITLLCMATLPSVALSQSAASYPSKPIRIVIGFAAGGPTDVFARMFAEHLQRKYKQPAVAENKPGAGSLVAADFVAKSTADGYTLLVASNNLAFESLLNKEASINTAKDVLPFGIFAGTGAFLAVNSGLPVKTMPELVAWIRANPGKLNVGTPGQPVAALEGLRDRLGLSWVNVNYKGGAPAFAALLAGEVNLYTADIAQGLEPMKAGRIRLIAYTDRQRHPALPDIPTVAESGIGATDFVFFVWLGMYAAAGVPEDIVAKLNADVNEMSTSAEATTRYGAMGWRAIPNSVAQIRKDSAAEVENVAALVAKGVKLR
jgi:tripartite-type tricarboxylate transporter receptor subunit TctC